MRDNETGTGARALLRALCSLKSGLCTLWSLSSLHSGAQKSNAGQMAKKQHASCSDFCLVYGAPLALPAPGRVERSCNIIQHNKKIEQLHTRPSSLFPVAHAPRQRGHRSSDAPCLALETSGEQKGGAAPARRGPRVHGPAHFSLIASWSRALGPWKWSGTQWYGRQQVYR